ncbi:exonuclease SbcCD C subunit [Clostridium sp. CAG:269]|nr:exonuclease SbcCD C subunit [Clostridium sp. CAG:269]
MKPLKIKISAFGPYKNCIDIDFEKLGESGIFLITGDTGAGKTTIFDSISFALFGEVSGSNRPVPSVRSDFADNDTETFVELEFTHKNKKYKIRRNPAYERTKKRGEGTTKTSADASLEYDDKVISGTKNVDIKIEEILGINSKQFKQISMLAQGEFLKILFAESKDRTEIFRRIFDTDIYNQIAKRLADKTRIAKAELEQLKDYFAINSSNIVWKDGIQSVQPKDVNELFIQEILEKLQQEIKINSEQFEKCQEQISKQSDENSKMEKEITAQKDKNDKIDRCQKLQEEQKVLQEKQEDIKQKEILIQKSQEIINKILPKEDKKKELEKEILQKQKVLQDISEKIELGKKKEEKFKQILELIEIIKVQFQKYSELKDGKTELEDKIKKLQVIIKEQENKKIASENAQKLEAEWEKLSTEVLEKEKEFFREQAGILAEKLKENEPCPVCGSLHHPNLAIKSTSVLTKEELDNLKEKEEKSRKTLTDATNKVTEINSKIETLIKEFGEKPDVELYNKKYAEISEELEKAYNQLNDNYKKIMLKDIVIESFEYDIFKEKITNKISKEREEFLKLQTQQEENKKQIDELLQKKEKAQNDYQNTLKELGFENEEQYKKSVLNNLQIEIFSKEIEKYKTDVTINATKLEEIQKEIKGFEKVDLTAKIQEFNNKKQELENMRKQQMEYHRIFENNNRILVDLQTNSKKLDSKIKEFTMVEDLSKIANGTVYGKRRIEFEQFVQASYFDMVIIEANKRLLKMTDNRFLLVRKESSERVSDKIGLELEVIDNYNGKRRDVKSLSGGEAFKAALSLALGLSDVIQSYSGGIVVDTMFIDEGFGSLDTESREQAINTLNQLTDNHKLIGIISHVTELKERIDKKVIVTKSTEGSKITIEC